MKLSGEQPAGEIADDSRINVFGIYTCVGDGSVRRFKNDVADGLTLLLEVASEVGASGAKNVNGNCHTLAQN